MRKDHYVSAPFRWRGHALWVTAAFLLALPVAVRADYLLRPGDVLGMEVYGVPELTHQSKLDPDGTVTLPLIGRLRVADLTVDEVHGMIFEALSSGGLPTVGGEGRDLERPIGFAEILVEVAEFGPVYVSGQIAVPGQVPYVPNMTVRQLLASAGGVGSAESNLAETVILRASLAAERDLALHRLETGLARVGRLQDRLRQLAGEDLGGGEAPLLGAAPGQSGAVLQVSVVPPSRPTEVERPSVSEVDTIGQDALVDVSPDDSGAPLDEQADLQTQLEEVSQLAAEARLEARRAQDQVLRDLLTAVNSELDSLRELGGNRAQLLDFGVQAAQINTDVYRLTAEAVERSAQQEIDLLDQIEAGLSELTLEEGRVESLNAQLAALGEPSEGPAGDIVVVLHRRGAASGEGIVVDLDQLLMPGDVVEVRGAPNAGPAQ